MPADRVDVAVIGGGIVGLATAMALLERGPRRIVVLEAEDTLAAHQTGHNSGVIHSGLYYTPGSLRARLCAAGREALFRFCAERGVPCERCGKVVVATTPEEALRLEDLERRGRANGLLGVRRVGMGELRELEPRAAGLAALHVPETGIVDFGAVARAYARVVTEQGGELRTGARLTALRRQAGGLLLETGRGELHAGAMVSCAGLQADRVARLAGLVPDVRILPFRGAYRKVSPARSSLVRNLIYPVPDPRFPFLGVHLTRTIGGSIEAGPDATLALSRHGYRRTDVSLPDMLEMAAWPGSWRMALRHGPRALAESLRGAGGFLRAVRRLVPEITAADLEPGGSGVRAQALDRDGRLLDDFHLVEEGRMLHVLNAPSPAATASLAIGRHLAARAWERFALD